MGSPNKLEKNLRAVPDFSISTLVDSKGQTAEEIKELLEKLRSPEVDAAVADQLCQIFLGKIWLPIASTLWKIAPGEDYFKVRAFDGLLSKPPDEWSDLFASGNGTTFERIIRRLFPDCHFKERLEDITHGNVVMVYTGLINTGPYLKSSTIRIFPTIRVVRIGEPGSDLLVTPISSVSKLWQFGDGKYDLSELTTPETLKSSLYGYGDKTRQLWHEYNNTIRLTDLKPPQSIPQGLALRNTV